jgi:hypothetical protein
MFTNVTQVFPLSLHELLALNDQVQQFSTKLDGIGTCHGCGRKSASLKQCGRCSSFWYCDRVRPPLKILPRIMLTWMLCEKGCQEAGWNEKGHKDNCKLLKDPDLRGLLFFKWDEFDNRIEFPLHVTFQHGT